MKINLVRIDDRLIHGQVATVWSKEANAQRIIICSDENCVFILLIIAFNITFDLDAISTVNVYLKDLITGDNLTLDSVSLKIQYSSAGLVITLLSWKSSLFSS